MSSQLQSELSPCVTLTSDSPRIEQPKKLKITLKQHQLALINRCRILENSSNNAYIADNHNIKTKFGIVGDIVGSGKTLTILGLIETEKSIKSSIPKYFSNTCISYIDNNSTNYVNYSNKKEFLNTNVIVVPHNIYKQWSSTIETHTDIKYIGVFNKKSYDKFRLELQKEAFDYTIILISSTKYKDISENDLYNYAFSRLIIDEADSIKITGSLLNNNFLWCVTSTYDVLCNPTGQRFYANAAGQLSKYYNPNSGFTNYIYVKGITSSIIKSFIGYSLCSL